MQLDAEKPPVRVGLCPVPSLVDRIFVRFKDDEGVTRGSTSVAVQTK